MKNFNELPNEAKAALIKAGKVCQHQIFRVIGKVERYSAEALFGKQVVLVQAMAALQPFWCQRLLGGRHERFSAHVCQHQIFRVIGKVERYSAGTVRKTSSFGAGNTSTESALRLWTHSEVYVSHVFNSFSSQAASSAAYPLSGSLNIPCRTFPREGLKGGCANDAVGTQAHVLGIETTTRALDTISSF